MTDCLFCAIGQDTEPSVCVHEDDHCKVFMDIFPVSKGHLLIIPKEHVVTYDELKATTRDHLSKITHKMTKAVMASNLGCKGYNMQVNNGVVANQHVPHLHLHVIPRYRGDMLRVMGQFILQAPGIFIGRRKHEHLEPAAQLIREALTRV